jgi:hypothetical protein
VAGAIVTQKYVSLLMHLFPNESSSFGLCDLPAHHDLQVEATANVLC